MSNYHENSGVDPDMESIMQQIHDEEMARAIQASLESDELFYNNEQERLDAEMAQRLDAEMAQEYQDRDSRMHTNSSHGAVSDINDDDSNIMNTNQNHQDNLDNILDEIREQENREYIKKHGNAYDGKLNLDRILALEDEKIEKMRRDMEMRFKNEDARKLRDEQDMEYEKLLAEHMNKLESSESVNPIIPDSVQSNSQVIDNTNSESMSLSDNVEIPKSARELREARLRFFQNQRK